MKQDITVCWLRRDLRLQDNAALYHALRGKFPVMLLFIFDIHILDDLHDRRDPRVTFIYDELQRINKTLQKKGTSLLIKYGTPETSWQEILDSYNVKEVYTNHDYEPYARERDDSLREFLDSEFIPMYTFKDQVIFEKEEITKADGKPYTVFTPYYKQWLKKLSDPFYLKSYPVDKYIKNLYQTTPLPIPTLKQMRFEHADQEFPSRSFEEKIESYAATRDYPFQDSTSRIGIHLRFGTVSIRQAATAALEARADIWLSELAWREFYMMILWHFPQTATKAFKPAYDNIKWRNNEQEFEAWKNGTTGYPLVDAGMNQLRETGFMHNRVRMVVASFLCKHLLIDWRWGEAYFAEKLLDYEMASNVGGWQWACGSGNDAAPYFRVFNPELQAKRFDSKNQYIFKWAPEYKTQKHAQPIVEHAFARERVLKVYKEALNS